MNMIRCFIRPADALMGEVHKVGVSMGSSCVAGSRSR